MLGFIFIFRGKKNPFEDVYSLSNQQLLPNDLVLSINWNKFFKFLIENGTIKQAKDF